MKCPVDDTTLQMTAREGVEIDYCPECRGIWLDRGELDRIIERAGERNGNGPVHDEHDEHAAKPKKKRLSFLTDLVAGGGED